MPLSETCKERCRLLHVRWQMVQRCHNPQHPSFADYGARGITVCDEWRASPRAFVDYVSPRPAGMTIDRIDNDQGYAPGNVRWATRAEQVRNRRNNILVPLDGKLLVLTDACAILGLNYDTVWNRIKRGVPPAAALVLPVQKRALTPSLAALIRSHLSAGRRQCDIARELGVSRGAVSDVSLGKSYINN